MTDTKYAEILNRSWDEIPQPKVLPVGTWLLRGRNAAFLVAKEDDKSDRVLFFYEAKEPMDDVDGAQLEALGTDYDFENNDIVKQFYINRAKDWDSVRKHLAIHGIDTAGRSQADTFNAFKGAEVLAYLNTKVYTNAAGQTVEDNDPTTFAEVA